MFRETGYLWWYQYHTCVTNRGEMSSSTRYDPANLSLITAVQYNRYRWLWQMSRPTLIGLTERRAADEVNCYFFISVNPDKPSELCLRRAVNKYIENIRRRYKRTQWDISVDIEVWTILFGVLFTFLNMRKDRYIVAEPNCLIPPPLLSILSFFILSFCLSILGFFFFLV